MDPDFFCRNLKKYVSAAPAGRTKKYDFIKYNFFEEMKKDGPYDVIVFEKLQIQNMVKNHKLAKSISDVAWAQFINFTKYKAEEDSLRFYFLGSNWHRRVEHHGGDAISDIEEPIIV